MLKIGVVNDLHGRVNNPISRLDNFPESILAKVEYVLKNNDITIFTGDIFNTYLTGILFVNKLLSLLVKYECMGKTILMIEGNHDLIGRDYDSITDTSLGTLTMGRNWLLTKRYITFTGDTPIEILPMRFIEDKPVIAKSKQADSYKIVVGHAYFEHPEYNDKWHVTSEDLGGKGYDIILLGHDHQYYEPVELKGGGFVLRSGSISRSTIDERDRELYYTQILIGDNEYDFKYVPLPHKPANEVFKVEDVSKEITRHKKNMEKIIELLQVEDSKLYSIDEALKELKCPQKYVSLIGEVLDD